MALAAAVLLYLALALPHLNLPGLHYDEAKEAGVNAMEMLRGQDVQAFRSAGVQIGRIFLPLMVQDYIGALNVYLALPFLALFGVTVPALRLVGVTCGLATLLLVWRLGREVSSFKWQVSSGRWQAASGKRQVESGKWQKALEQGGGERMEQDAGQQGNGERAPDADVPSSPITDHWSLFTDHRQTWTGEIAALLLAVSPSFVFWSRQGIFVTNVVVTLAVATVLTGLRWWRTRRPRTLYLLAVLAGLGLWAKLLFVWMLGAMAGVVVVMWVGEKFQVSRVRGQVARGKGKVESRKGKGERGKEHEVPERSEVEGATVREEEALSGEPGRVAAEDSTFLLPPSSFRLPPSTFHLLIALILFLLALSPLILFNQQTGGTLQSIFGNLDQSYYGVSNADFLQNLSVRIGQLAPLLRGSHLWYLGEPFANAVAPWIATAIVVAALALALLQRERAVLARLLLALLFVALLVVQSSFTVSDLFITHDAIIQPFVILLVALAADSIWQMADGRKAWRIAAVLLLMGLAAWLALDLRTDVRYHQALARSGGQAAHSDASYRLAQWLDERKVKQPLALDWGIDAPVRYLTENRVEPLEIFGYDRLDAPDPGFDQRALQFLSDPTRYYILRMPADTVFRGRREALEKLAAAQGLTLAIEQAFYDGSGKTMFVILHAEPM